MNILILQEKGRHAENENFREALSLQRAFNNVLDINPAKDYKQDNSVTVSGLNYPNYQAVLSAIPMDMHYRGAYDMIILLENYDETGWIPYEHLKLSKAFKVFWSIDSHMNMNSHCMIVQKFRPDLVLCAIESNCKFFKSDAADYTNTVVYMPNAYDDDLVRPIPDTTKECFLGFCGSVLDRAAILGKLYNHDGIRLDILKIGEDMVRCVNSYEIHFNKSIANDINYRVFETLGCKTCLITNRVEGLNKLFVDREHLWMYDSYEDVVGLLKYFRKNPEQIKRTAELGYHLVKELHTYKSRAKDIIFYYCQFSTLKNK